MLYNKRTSVTLKCLAIKAASTFSLILILFLSSCKKEAKPDLQYLEDGPFLSLFNEEAKKHGLDFYDKLLSLEVGINQDYSEILACEENKIYLESLYESRLFTLRQSYYYEQLFFHALGHCLLGREHDDSKLPNGEWKSIMRSEPFLGGKGNGIDYMGAKRDYYLAELFDPSTKSSDYFNDQPINLDTILDKVLLLNTNCGSSHLIDTPIKGDYEIVVKLVQSGGLDYLNIRLTNDSTDFFLIYDQSFNWLRLGDLRDYGSYYSVRDADSSYYPSSNSSITIRRVGNTFTVFMDGKSILNRQDEDNNLEFFSVTANGICSIVSLYQLN